MKLDDYCRLCLIKSSKNSEEIFFPIDSPFEMKFSDVTNISLVKPSAEDENAKFPSKVCMTCVTELDKHIEYRNRIIENQKRLNSLLGYNSEISERHQPETPEALYIKDEGQTYFQEELEEEDEEIFYQSDQQGSESKPDKVTPEFDETFESAYKQDEFMSQIISSEGEEGELEEEVDDEMETTIELEEEEYQLEESTDEYQVCVVNNQVEEEENYVEYGGEIPMEEVSLTSKRKYVKQPKDTPRQFKCWIKNCGGTFSFRATMKKHMLQLHSINCDKSTCFICGNHYNNYAEFLAHVKNHTRKSQCDVCKLTFVNNERLENHKIKFHKKNDDEGRNFECHICNARFKRKEHVNSHFVYKHTSSDKNARKFECVECSSMFLTRQDLKNHGKSHSQVKINCIYCNYNCRDLKSIRRHCLKLHDTVKIYKCPCEETFELHRDLQTHRKHCSGTVVTEY